MTEFDENSKLSKQWIEFIPHLGLVQHSMLNTLWSICLICNVCTQAIVKPFEIRSESTQNINISSILHGPDYIGKYKSNEIYYYVSFASGTEACCMPERSERFRIEWKLCESRWNLQAIYSYKHFTIGLVQRLLTGNVPNRIWMSERVRGKSIIFKNKLPPENHSPMINWVETARMVVIGLRLWFLRWCFCYSIHKCWTLITPILSAIFVFVTHLAALSPRNKLK